MQVAIIFGSTSDKEIMAKAGKALDELGISYGAYVASAHRVPELLDEILADVIADGAKVIIAGAGLAAHLPGVIASKVTLPVIGVPLAAALDGQDALYSIVQMPKGIPVATVGINNAYNAGMLAAQILGITDEAARKAVENYRETTKANFTNKQVAF